MPVVVSPDLLILFEDRILNFELALDPSPAMETWVTFNVQIENPSTALCVQLTFEDWWI